MPKITLFRILTLIACIVGISLLHYLTPLHLHYLHDIFQRLYYLPIILAAFWFGLRGGLLCSIVVSIVYAPHILFQWGEHPGMEIEKYLEIVLYNTVGGVTGLLSQRERERSLELEQSAQGLKESYQKLQQQSEQIIGVEEQLRKAEKLSMLGEMAAVLAHEIRNPLSSIRGTAEILKDDYPPGDPKHEFIEIQIRETERLNRVVEEFLLMAPPQPVELLPCPIQHELETMVTLVSNDARERQINLLLQSQDLPIVIMGNGEKLRQAFLNIIINALQATPPGGEVIMATKVLASGFCEPKLLRALQEKEVEPVGGTIVQKVDVRIVSATNLLIDKAIATGTFREDLYYRLSVIPIHLPPLRERKEDIPLFLRYFSTKHCKSDTITFEHEAIDSLTRYPWPGNVRELENTVERLLIMRNSNIISCNDLPDKFREPQREGRAIINLPDEGYSLEQLEREIVVDALVRNGWNQTASARFLRIPRHTLLYRIEKYGIELPEK